MEITVVMAMVKIKMAILLVIEIKMVVVVLLIMVTLQLIIEVKLVVTAIISLKVKIITPVNVTANTKVTVIEIATVLKKYLLNITNTSGNCDNRNPPTLGGVLDTWEVAIWPTGTSCTKSWMLLRSRLAIQGAFFWFFRFKTSGPPLAPPCFALIAPNAPGPPMDPALALDP